MLDTAQERYLSPVGLSGTRASTRVSAVIHRETEMIVDRRRSFVETRENRARSTARRSPYHRVASQSRRRREQQRSGVVASQQRSGIGIADGDVVALGSPSLAGTVVKRAMREKRQEEVSRRLASIRRDLAARLARISHSILIVTVLGSAPGTPIARGDPRVLDSQGKTARPHSRFASLFRAA